MRHSRALRAFMAVPVMLLLLFSAVSARGEKTVLLTFTGDCTLGSEDRYRNRDDSFNGYARIRGYDYFFANYREMFEEDDCTVINLEGVFTDSDSMKRNSKTYCFRGPTEFAEIIAGSGIELCGLANNHTADYGAQGMVTTKETLDSYGIAWCRAEIPYILEKDGIRIAFFSIDYGINVKQGNQIRDIIREMKRNGEADAVIILHHNGNEYSAIRSEKKQERVAKSYVDAGADLVIMNHAHVVQGIEIYRNRTLCYALGNFVFGGNASIRTESFRDRTVTSLYSLVVQARLVFSDSGKYLGQTLTLYPSYSSEANPEGINTYQPRRLTPQDAAAVADAIQYDTNFELPPVTADEQGLSRINMPYLAAFDDVMIPEDENEGPYGMPAPAPAAPGRDNKQL